MLTLHLISGFVRWGRYFIIILCKKRSEKATKGKINPARSSNIIRYLFPINESNIDVLYTEYITTYSVYCLYTPGRPASSTLPFGPRPSGIARDVVYYAGLFAYHHTLLEANNIPGTW